jgi:hypothetical protein
MSEILGKMEKPEASQFKKGRKLFFVPLVFRQMEEDPAFSEIAKRYWNEVEEQLTSLESRLSDIKKVYHELIAGKEGLKQMKEMSTGSNHITGVLAGKGAALTDIEDNDILMEFMDWGKCLSSGLQSPAVFSKAYAAYEEAGKKRDENIAKHIDETLAEDETAVIFMREGHHVQFPADIQIFYVAPPSLDALKRAVREQQEALYRSYTHDHKHEDKEKHAEDHKDEPAHEHEEEHEHEHEHEHDDGNTHSHSHSHEGEHKHEHKHDDQEHEHGDAHNKEAKKEGK